MRILLLLSSLILISISDFATTIVVDSTNNAGFGSLREAIYAASNNDSIRFNPNLIANGSDSIVLDSSIVFSKSITITGLYTPTDTLFISGGGVDRIFTIDSTTFIGLDSLVLLNGFAINNGGAIYSNKCDSLWISNSIFRNNEAGQGGAIYATNNGSYSECFLRMENSIVKNNLADDGGGVFLFSTGYFVTAKVNIINSRFLSNGSRIGNGGALRLRSTYFIVSNINNCVFKENYTLNGSGQAMLLYANHEILLDIRNSEISFNDAGSVFVQPTGKAIELIAQKSELFLLNSEVNDNIGGGINLKSDSNLVNIQGSQINRNGGTGYSTHSSTYPNIDLYDSLYIKDSKVNGNLNEGLKLTSGSSHRPNLNSKSIVNMDNCGVENNASGISIFSFGDSDCKVTRSTVANNSSVGIGFESFVLANCIINTSTICNNGALGISFSGTSQKELVLNSTTITGNSRAFSYHLSHVMTLTIYGTIIALNSTELLGSPTINSGGYNLIADTGFITLDTTDIIGVDSISLNLDSLKRNGGFTKTMMPLFPSIVIDAGNPNDTINAQNVAIVGVREVGACEVCFSTTSTDTIIGCDNYTWIDGVTYFTNNNTAKDTLINSAGCDSVVTLSLTLIYSTSIIDTVMVCDSLLWIDGLTYHNDNNTAQVILTNAVGCDSIITLNLTILTSFSVDTLVACDSLTWMNGMTYFSNNTTATDTLVSSMGCDSIVTLNLTINTVDSSVIVNGDTLIANQNGATYQWYNCSGNVLVSGANSQTFIPTVTGNYFVEVTMNGCVDSSVCNQIYVCGLNANFALAHNGVGDYTFTNNSTGSFSQQYWSFGDGTNSTLSSPNHTYLANGVYVVVLAIRDPNTTNLCVDYFVDTVVVTSVLNSLTCKAGYSVYPDASANGLIIVNSSTGNTLSYLWDFGDGSTSTQQFPTHSYATAGPFNLCLTVDDGTGCVDTYCDSITENGSLFRAGGFDITVVSGIPLDMNDVSNSESSVLVYPNPAQNEFSLELSNWRSKQVTISIRDINGKTIQSKIIKNTTGKESVNFETENWSRGVYLVKVIDGEKSINKKLILN
jgi:predicted outer membrane repeat protein